MMAHVISLAQVGRMRFKVRACEFLLNLPQFNVSDTKRFLNSHAALGLQKAAVQYHTWSHYTVTLCGFGIE